jgi:hypothetical protein
MRGLKQVAILAHKHLVNQLAPTRLVFGNMTLVPPNFVFVLTILASNISPWQMQITF